MLLCLVLIVIATLAYQRLLREEFVNIAYADTESSVCPVNLTAKRKDNIVFCNDKKGLPTCALIADDETRNGIPACHTIINKYLENQDTAFCPPSMPRYFENPAARTSGCTASQLVPNKTAPADLSAPTCTVHKNTKDMTDRNSCFNQKQLEMTPLFGTNATKQLISYIGNPAAYITMMSYNAPNSQFVNQCYADTHLSTVLNKMQSKDPQVVAITTKLQSGIWGSSCSAHKKVYIDHTLQTSDLIN
jgi:hypothetical protein